MALADARPEIFERVVGVAFVSTSSGALDTVTLGLPEAGQLLRAQIPRMLALRSRTLSRRARRRAPIVETAGDAPVRVRPAAAARRRRARRRGADQLTGRHRGRLLRGLHDPRAHPRAQGPRRHPHARAGRHPRRAHAAVARPPDRRPRRGSRAHRRTRRRPHAPPRARPARLRRPDPAGPSRACDAPPAPRPSSWPPDRARGSARRPTRCCCPSTASRSSPARCGPSSTSRACTAIVLVVRPEDREDVSAAVAPHLGAHDLWLVDGGEQRHDSEWQALQVLAADIENDELDVVAIHDGARPLASADLWRAVIDAAAEHGGAIPVVDVPRLSRTRRLAGARGLVGVQTPQAFRAARPARRLPPGRGRTGSSAPTPAACLERYTEVAIVGRAEHGGQPEGDLPRGHRRSPRRCSAPSPAEGDQHLEVGLRRRSGVPAAGPAGDRTGNRSESRRDQSRRGRRCRAPRARRPRRPAARPARSRRPGPPRSTVAPSAGRRRTP